MPTNIPLARKMLNKIADDLEAFGNDVMADDIRNITTELMTRQQPAHRAPRQRKPWRLRLDGNQGERI